MVYHLTTREQVTYESQLQQMVKTIFQSKTELGIWSNKLIDIRALQMDEAIAITEEENNTIDIMEEYIIKYQQLLQDITEKLNLTKDILFDSSYCPISLSNIPPTTDINLD